MEPELMCDALDDLAADMAEQAAEAYNAQAAQIMREFREKFGDQAAMQMICMFHASYQPTEEQARGVRAHMHAAGVPLQRGRK